MKNDFELELENLTQEMEEPSEEGFLREKRIYEKSLEVVQTAMKDVLQEILIVLPDETSHIIYVTDIDISPDGEVRIGFNTPSEARKGELYEHVMKCVKIQIEEILAHMPKKKFKLF